MTCESSLLQRLRFKLSDDLQGFFLGIIRFKISSDNSTSQSCAKSPFVDAEQDLTILAAPGVLTLEGCQYETHGGASSSSNAGELS